MRARMTRADRMSDRSSFVEANNTMLMTTIIQNTATRAEP